MKAKIFTFLLYLAISHINVFAVDYTYLAPIPNQNNLTEKEMTINENTLQAYFKNLYRLGIVLATGLAVLMVMWGGIEYITTDAMGGKEEAKERISSAIMGLLLALGSFVILRTIDPNLVSVKLTIEQVDLSKVEDNVGEFDFPEADTEPPLTGSETVTGDIPNNAPIVNDAELQTYLNHGKYAYIRPGSVHNDTLHNGYHSPYIEYIWHYVENNFRPFKTNNTFRDPNHEQSLKTPGSDHIVGQAIDFYAPNLSIDDATFINRGLAIVDWARQNGSTLGIDQIIFRDKNYRWNGNAFVNGNAVGGHYNHVHIGRIRDGSQNWGPRQN